MIIFGTRGNDAILGHVVMTCAFCANTCAQTFRLSRRHLTLFFVPLVPISSTYSLICTACGRGRNLDKARAAQMQAYIAAALAAGPRPTGLDA